MKTDYNERTRRLEAWGRFFDTAGKNVVRFIWLAVFFIILVALGRYLVATSVIRDEVAASGQPRSKPIPTPGIEWSEIDKAILGALETAREAALAKAQAGLDEISAGWTERVDNNFLEWYFGYWNQQKMGLQGIVRSIHHWFDEEAPTAAESVTQTIQEEFANRVLRPQITQLELEQLTRDVVDVYIQSLQREIEAVRGRYQIPQEEWDRYLSSIAAMTSTVEGNRKVDLSLKAIAGATVAGSVLLGKALVNVAGKLGSKVSAQFAGKAAAKMAAKTGGKVAAKMGGKLLGPIVGVGIIVWDIWDHQATKAESRPILRENLLDYLGQIEESLLNDPESGILAVIHQIEGSIAHSIQERAG